MAEAETTLSLCDAPASFAPSSISDSRTKGEAIPRSANALNHPFEATCLCIRIAGARLRRRFQGRKLRVE
jgi:hypothetical protein